MQLTATKKGHTPEIVGFLCVCYNVEYICTFITEHCGDKFSILVHFRFSAYGCGIWLATVIETLVKISHNKQSIKKTPNMVINSKRELLAHILTLK